MTQADRLLELFMERLAIELADRIERRLAERASPSSNGVDTLFNVQTAAEHLGVSLSMLKGMIRSGQLAIVRIGDRVLIPASAVQAFIESSTELNSGNNSGNS